MLSDRCEAEGCDRPRVGGSLLCHWHDVNGEEPPRNPWEPGAEGTAEEKEESLKMLGIWEHEGGFTLGEIPEHQAKVWAYDVNVCERCRKRIVLVSLNGEPTVVHASE